MSIAQSSVSHGRPNSLRAARCPHLLEVAARPFVRHCGDRATLDDVPDEVLDRIAARGFHAVWLMGVWRTSPFARREALGHPALRAEYARLLGNYHDADVGGSPYAIEAYEVAESLGGDVALARFRERLRRRGVSLVLDFVPNHLARDHPWLDRHPQRLVRGTERDLAKHPDNWFLHTDLEGREHVFAHGRDPYFAGWTDTVQVDYRNAEARSAMRDLLASVAERCDGVRCDMAMLLLAEVFASTWGGERPPGDFWDEAIAEIRRRHPGFVFIAEVYWGLEDELHTLGFDYTYDKELYDRLVAADRAGIRSVLSLPQAAQSHRVRFLENHDEPRSRSVFGDRLVAAAAITYSLPGLRFFFEGQSDGRWHRIPVQLAREPFEERIEWVARFYDRLFEILSEDVFHAGQWCPQPVDSRAPEPSWILGSRWTLGEDTRIVLANVSGSVASGAVRWPLPENGSDMLVIVDEVTNARYEYSRRSLREAGLPVELGGYGAHFLRIAD